MYGRWRPAPLRMLAALLLCALGAIGMVGVSTLTGLAFAAPIVAFSVTQKSDQGFAFIFRLIITPLTFFSGTYFPIENLPVAAQAISWLTPLAHGVALDRGGGTEREAPVEVRLTMKRRSPVRFGRASPRAPRL